MHFRLSTTVAVLGALSVSRLPLEAGGISAQTSTPYATTAGPGTSPSASVPTGLTGLPDLGADSANPGQHFLKLNWQASSGATGYIVERQDIASGNWTQVATTSVATFEDNYYTPGAYRYRVSAKATNAPTSAPSSVIPQPINYAVIDLGANVGPVKITNTGLVLLTFPSQTNAYGLWTNGTLASYSPQTTGDSFTVNDIAENGAAIGWENVVDTANVSNTPNPPAYQTQLAIWSAPGTATLTAPTTVTIFPSTPDGPARHGEPSNQGIAIAQVNGTLDEWSYKWQADGSSTASNNGTPSGNIANTFSPLPSSPWLTETVAGTSTSPMVINNQGDLISLQTTYSSGPLTSGYYLNSSALPLGTSLFDPSTLVPMSLSNHIGGTSRLFIIGEFAYDLVVWDSNGGIYHLLGAQLSDDIVSGTASINAATTMINGTSVASPQTIYGNFIQSMNPITGAFDPPQPATVVSSGWNGITLAGGPHVINDSGAIIGTATKTSDSTSHGILLITAELAVDADRNGTIVMQNDVYNSANVDADGNPLPADTTSSTKPYRFWVNNDEDYPDSSGNPETIPATTPDSQWVTIAGTRDLEDWARLWIYMKGLNSAIHSGQIKVGLKWIQVTSGTPGIKLATASDADGGLEYIQNASAALAQTDQDHNDPGNPLANNGRLILKDAITSSSEIVPTTNAADFVFPQWVWTNLTDTAPKSHFIFEGSSKGKGQLEIVFLKADGTTKLGEGGSVWLDLHDIKEMYERAIASQNGSSTSPQPPIPVGTATPTAPNITEAPDTTGGTFVTDPNESSTHTYVVFVHGFNQTYDGSTTFAETMLKRLWWRGYKGRFAAFRWPTYGNGTDYVGGAVGTYNDSEYVAWHSGSALKHFIQRLPLGYTVDIAAHSMGNEVVGEAIREGMSVRNYAMLHAAPPACCYNTGSGSPAFVTTDTSGILAPDNDTDSGTKGLAYSGWLGAIGGNPNNFYDTSDSVVGSIWNANNSVFKPQAVLTGIYGYNGLQPAGQKLFYENLIATRYLTDQGEVKAYDDHSVTGAIGYIATINNEGSIRSSTSDSGFGDEHSSEWVRNIQDPDLQTFYNTLTGPAGFSLQVNP